MDSDTCKSYNLVDDIWMGHKIKLDMFNPFNDNDNVNNIHDVNKRKRYFNTDELGKE